MRLGRRIHHLARAGAERIANTRHGRPLRQDHDRGRAAALRADELLERALQPSREDDHVHLAPRHPAHRLFDGRHARHLVSRRLQRLLEPNQTRYFAIGKKNTSICVHAGYAIGRSRV